MEEETLSEFVIPLPVDLPGSRTTISAILISVFLMGAGMGVQGSAVSLRAGLEGFSESLVGLIMSAKSTQLRGLCSVP
ncbi:MAG: hypothetical protein LC641_13145 [Spirochaeta sp.]|nr:hypothetical protein [Spirochaeta sp.]